MGGAIIQLVARGIQDTYLTSDPQITFFKVLYRRYTNFSIESIPQYFSSAANFGETVSCTISRAGDLVGQIYLYVEIPAIPMFTDNGQIDEVRKFAWVRNLGHALIQEVSIEIGGKLIDKQYGEWMHIWSELTSKQDDALNKMIGNVPEMYDFSNGKASYQLYVPLHFWFCRNNGLSLPLIALASSDVKLTVTFRKLEECYRIGPTHSIEILEDIVPFEPGDYIEQTVNSQTIYGYVINYDYLHKKLNYIKIQCPSAKKKAFETYQDDNNPFNTNDSNTLFIQFKPNKYSEKKSSNNINCHSHMHTHPGVPTNPVNHVPYRIYNSITRSYCTPKPNTREYVEQTDLPFKPYFVNAFLYVDYVYLDTEERSKFSRTTHEYLIEQIQFNQEIDVQSPNIKQDLTLNHPCKAHYWIVQLDSLVGPGTINDLFNYTSSHIRLFCFSNHTHTSKFSTANTIERSTANTIKGSKFSGTNIVEKVALILNGRSRFGERGSYYTNLVEPYEHHHRGPSIGINIYSPSLYPENHQPSSTINMSKIDHICMQMRLNNTINPQNTARIRSYTINYNILKIFYNMGGLAFM